MRTEQFEGGEWSHFDQNEEWQEKLDKVQTELAGPVKGKSRKDLEDYASYLKIKIDQEKNNKDLPN